MRVRELHIRAYGHLIDRQFSDLPPGLVIVLGTNEAGKSTLFSLLSTLFYGFYPVKDFPYRPWHKDLYPEFKAVLDLDDGSSAEVTRKLMSTPRAALNWNGSAEDLGNRNLPFVGHAGRELYGAVYALTQANLQSLDDAQRDEIEDRLLSGLSAELLRPTRDAVSELENRAGRLWRPSRRGDQRYRALKEAVRSAREQRDAARQADETVRGKAARLHDIQREMEDLTAEKARLGAEIRNADELSPVREKLKQIKGWREQIRNPEAVDTLPEGLHAVYDGLLRNTADAEKEIDDLKEDTKQLAEQQAVFTPEDNKILEYADDIDRWARRISVHEREQASLADSARKEEQLMAVIKEKSGTVFSKPWERKHFDAVETVVLPDLKANISAFEEKRRRAENRVAEAGTAGTVQVGGALPVWVSAAAAAAGAVLLAVGLVYGWEVLSGTAVFLVLAAGFNFYLDRQRKLLQKRDSADRQLRDKRTRTAETERDEAGKAVAETLAGLPVAEALLANPDITLYQTVEKLHAACAEFRQLEDQREEQEKQWQTQQDDLEKLTDGLGHGSAAPETLQRIEQQLAAARAHETAWNEADVRIGQIETALSGHEQKLDEVKQELKRFLDRLKNAVGEDMPPEDLLNAAAELQHLAGRIRDAEEELEDRHPDLADLESEIGRIETASEDAWSFDPVEVQEKRNRLEEVQQKLEECREEKGRLESEIESEKGQISVGELDGKIEMLEEEMEETARERDRLMMLACLLREADRRFRRKHQPDVLKRAGDYLRTITHGRYTTLTTMPADDGNDRLVVMTDKDEVYTVEPPLSGGTLDQIYLSFRLAVIDHLDENHETLPLLLDEAFINCDEARLHTSGEILKKTAERRQVFLFTCHPWLAERFTDIAEASTCEL